MQAMRTPMHLILPALAQQLTGALCLGSFSFSAILDPGLLGAHHNVALVVLDAPCLPSVEAHAAQGIKLESYRLDILDWSTADFGDGGEEDR